MFWSSIATSSAVDKELDKEDVRLEDILELDEVLQELRGGNRRLSEFLLRPDNLHAMIDLIITAPDEGLPLGRQYKLPNVACELLTSDVLFGEKIAADRGALEKMFSFFNYTAGPLNPILASYVCRVISDIVARKHDQNWYSYQLKIIQLLGFLTEQGADILDWILSHIGTSSVCDLLNKLILNLEGPDMRANLLDWLIKENFVERLITKLGGENYSVHEGVNRLLVDLLAAFRDDMSSTDSDILYSALVSPATLRTLFCVILDVSNPVQSSIIYGLNAVVALLGIPELTERPPEKSWVPVNESMEHIVIDPEVKGILLTRLKDLGLLLKKEPSESLKLASGVVTARVGTMRLSIIKYIAHIASLRKPEFLDEIVRLGILEDVLELFWSNSTNGFMHRAVEKIINNILYTEEKNNAIKHLFLEEKLLIKITQLFESPKRQTAYQGILARIATCASNVSCVGFQNEVYLMFCNKYRTESNVWETFVFEGLEDYIKKQRMHLGGVIGPAPGATVQTPEDLVPADQTNVWKAAVTRSNAFDDLSNNVDFDVFSGTDLFDDNRSKSMFEMFCSERSNGVTEEDDLNIGLNDEDKFENCSNVA